MKQLTKRELECVQLLGEGFSDPEIGAMLGISHRTARFHVDNARQKVGAQSRTSLVAKMASSGEINVVKLSNQAETIHRNFVKRLLADGWVKLPPGYKIVPVTPTPEQQLAAGGVDASDTYRKMVDAAPAVPDGEG